MKMFAPNITDGYKIGHPGQYDADTETITSNFTPRDYSYAISTPFTNTNKMVFVGLQYACKAYLIDLWNDTFFAKPKAEVIAKFARRIKNYLGTGQGAAALDMMAALHDVGYLPIQVKALPEGSRVNAGIPVFVVTCTKPEFAPMHFYALVNYLETVLSNVVWPMCNSASLMEQYHLLAKHYGNMTGASEEFWLPFAIHNFALRGHRGPEDGIMSAFGHSLFHKGTDTFAVIDFAEDYYGADSDKEMIGVSVNATEHATVCQQIALHGGDEEAALRHFLTNVYPTGVFAYVADSKDYWNVIENISLALKPIIMARGANSDGQPGVLTFRPDSSPDTPLEIIMGYKVLEVGGIMALTDDDTAVKFFNEDYQVVSVRGKFYRAETESDVEDFGYGDTCRRHFIVLGREMGAAEVKGTLQVLWENFGGGLVYGRDDTLKQLDRKTYKLLDSHVRIIYGEAISLDMAHRIYEAMYKAGWCVGNVLFGVGSWAFIGNSSRDSYGLAMKATNSVVAGIDVALQKDPKGTSSFKKSAKGRLRVEWNSFTKQYDLYDQQSMYQEAGGELQLFFLNSRIVNEQTYSGIVARLQDN